jgi:predicted phage-related endonuclease
MIYHDVIQGSDEWHILRSTRFTASNFHKLFAKESTKTYQNLINEIVFARLTGEVSESYQSEWMKRGNDLEAEAIEAYELETFNKATPIGFVELDEWVGCSPDSLVGDDGQLQIKCPKATTLMDYYISEGYEDYYVQLQGELYVTGRKWNDLYVYHPKLKSILTRFKRNEETITEIKLKIMLAVEQAQERIKKISKWQ